MVPAKLADSAVRPSPGSPRIPPRTGTEFVDTASNAQHDRPNRYHCGVRRTRSRVRLRAPRGWFLVVALLAAVTAACGSTSAGAGSPIRFGVTGGNIAGWSVTIEPRGSVRVRNSHGTSRRQIASARARRLAREIQDAHLADRRCPGALPDFAARFIRLGDRKVTVRGTCEARFERVWSDLVRAAGLT